MRIINKIPKTEKIIKQYKCVYHIKTVSEITEEQASILLKDNNGYSHVDMGSNKYCKILIDYPLNVTVELKLKVKNIKRFGSLLWKIAQAYKTIYEEEEKTTTTIIIPRNKRKGMINRNPTDGKYGIWGHDLEDLYFEEIEIYDNGVIELFIGS